MSPDHPHFVRSGDRLVAVLPPARAYSAHWRRRRPLTHLESLAALLSDGPLLIEGGGVTWRISTVEGFADWLELVYEGGEPLGLSARFSDRPRIGADTLSERLEAQGCIVQASRLDPATAGPLLQALMMGGELPGLSETGGRSEDATALAELYRAIKIWMPPGPVSGGDDRTRNG